MVSSVCLLFASGCVNYKKGCTRLAAANDKVYQLLAHGLWFSPGTPASSTTKTGRHDIAEILLKVALNTTNQINLYGYWIRFNPSLISVVLDCLDKFVDAKGVIRGCYSRTDNTMAKRKRLKKINNGHYAIKSRWATQTPVKNEGELSYSRRVISSCSNSGTHKLVLVMNKYMTH